MTATLPWPRLREGWAGRARGVEPAAHVKRRLSSFAAARTLALRPGRFVEKWPLLAVSLYGRFDDRRTTTSPLWSPLPTTPTQPHLPSRPPICLLRGFRGRIGVSLSTRLPLDDRYALRMSVPQSSCTGRMAWFLSFRGDQLRASAQLRIGRSERNRWASFLIIGWELTFAKKLQRAFWVAMASPPR